MVRSSAITAVRCRQRIYHDIAEPDDTLFAARPQ
jgi:hypothetical protein